MVERQLCMRSNTAMPAQNGAAAAVLTTILGWLDGIFVFGGVLREILRAHGADLTLDSAAAVETNNFIEK